MLNEIMSMKQSLESWGVEVPSGFHHKFFRNPKAKGAGYIAVVSDEDIERFELFPEFGTLYHYEEADNFHWALILKLDTSLSTERIARKIKGHIETNIKLATTCDSNSKLEAFCALTHSLEVIGVEPMAQLLRDELDKLDLQEGSIYIGLEAAGDHAVPVQSLSFVKALSRHLLKAEKTTEQGNTDDFGNTAAGCSEKVPKVKAKYNIPIYSKNEDNPCFTRFGMTSTDAFRIGSESRKMISDILKFMLDESKQIRNGRDGYWYEYSPRKSNRKFIVLTTLFPKDHFLEHSGEEHLSISEWDTRTQELANAVLRQQPGQTPFGRLIVFEVARGTWPIRDSRRYSADFIYDKVRRWQEGMKNGCLDGPMILEVPSLFQIMVEMNKLWKWDNSRGGYVSVKESPRFSLADAYSLLFEDGCSPGGVPPVAKKFMAHFANNIVPMYWATGAELPYTRRYHIPLLYLLLHKLGIHYNGGTYMESWAHYLGRILKQSNYIYKMFFTSRGRRLPPTLIGQSYYRMALTHPRRAFALFNERFATTLAWAESTGASGVGRLSKLVSRLAELCPELPTRCTEVEKSLLAAGYLHWEKLAETSTIETLEKETVSNG